MNQDYWRKQDPKKPLFPDIEWSKPEQRAQRGKLLIIGGSQHGFAAVVRAYQTALESGAGEVKVIMPDVLAPRMPSNFDDGVFLPSNSSGGLKKDNLEALLASAAWSDSILLVGDSGQNSETAILFERLLSQIENTWITITRDTIGLLANTGENLVNRKNNLLVMSFSQTQKIFSTVYYPKILTFSMNLSNLVEAMHKFSTTYPSVIVSLHQGNVIIAQNGEIVSQKVSSVDALIDGSLATKAATYLLWNQTKPLEAVATSIL